MKRCYLGAGLLALLLLVGAVSTWWMGRHHTSLAGDIRHATELALAGETEQAISLTRRTQQGWEEKWSISASLAAHEPMERVDALFGQLETYAAAGEFVAFAGCCSQLASELEAIADESSFTWWNVL